MNNERAKIFTSAVIKVAEGHPHFFNADGNLNAAAIARFVKKPQPTIHRILSGKNNPSDSTISAFAKAFGVAPAIFRGEIDAINQLNEGRASYSTSDIDELLTSYTVLPVRAQALIRVLATTLADLDQMNTATSELLRSESAPNFEPLIIAVTAVAAAKKRPNR